MSGLVEKPDILLRVLLVESDSAVISEIVLNLSEIKECALQVASSKTEWTNSVRETRPDIVVLSDDVIQPTGFSVLEELHGDDEKIYKIGLLPEKDLERITAYIEAGVNQCIFKDGHYVSEIVDVINAAIAKLKPPEEQAANDEWLSMVSAFQPGDMILHYRIVEAIGEGGMGEVYKATDLKLGRTVAIKVLPVRVAGDAIARKRLIREARSASALNHPNIVTIHAIEETGKSCFIVMEFLEGQSLASKILQEPLEMKYLVDLTAQVASALGAAHAIGLIHRDIKPENIMITKDGHVKLLDFGLAKRSIGAAESVTNLTESGAISGTVSYMSPEQTHGQPLDPRTDIFSLGCVLYRAATGQLPFSGDSVLDILNAINSYDPPPASSIHKRLPHEFDLILARAMAKDREERYATAYEFAEALKKVKAFVTGQSISVRLEDLPSAPKTGPARPLTSAKKPGGQVSTNKLVARRDGATDLKPVTFSVRKPAEKNHTFAILVLLALGIGAVASVVHYSRPKKETTHAAASVPISPPPTRTVQEAKPASNENVDELTFWKKIKTSTNPKDFRDYLLRYPEGEFSDTAWQKIKELEGHAANATAEEVHTASSAQPASNQLQPSPPAADEDSARYNEQPADAQRPQPPPQESPNGRPGGPGGQRGPGGPGGLGGGSSYHEAPAPPFFPPRPGSLILTGSTWHMYLNADIYFHFIPDGTVYMKAPFLPKSGVCGSWVQNPTSITINVCDGSKWEGERDGSRIRWSITSADGSAYNNVDSEQAESAVDW